MLIAKSKRFWFISVVVIFGLFIKFAYYSNYESWINLQDFSYQSSFISASSLMNSTASSTTPATDNGFRFLRKYRGRMYTGKHFDKKWNKYLDKLGLLSVNETDDKKILHSRPVIISAFSSNHFGEARTMMDYISNLYNNTKILYIYDLGLNDDQKLEIYNTSNYNDTVIEVKPFPFEKYPDYFKNLGEFRWKPILIAEMLLKHPVVWYMDTSIQFRKSVDVVYETIQKCSDDFFLCPTYPWILVERTEHSIFSATNPRMYDYLPMPDYWNKNISMYAGGLELIYGLKQNKENVLRYWVLCALEKDCMGPQGAQVYCNWGENRWAHYAQCHRFDQSAINILMSWITGFREDRYNHPIANDALKVVRGK